MGVPQKTIVFSSIIPTSIMVFSGVHFLPEVVAEPQKLWLTNFLYQKSGYQPVFLKIRKVIEYNFITTGLKADLFKPVSHSQSGRVGH